MRIESSPEIFKKKAIPVSEKTYEYLKLKVLSGRFNPGNRLTKEHLAEQLGSAIRLEEKPPIS